VKVREALDARDGFTSKKRFEIYELFSELAGHPNMKSSWMMLHERWRLRQSAVMKHRSPRRLHVGVTGEFRKQLVYLKRFFDVKPSRASSASRTFTGENFFMRASCQRIASAR